MENDPSYFMMKDISFIPADMGYIHWCQKYIYILEWEKEIHCSLSSRKNELKIASRVGDLIRTALVCIYNKNNLYF